MGYSNRLMGAADNAMKFDDRRRHRNPPDHEETDVERTQCQRNVAACDRLLELLIEYHSSPKRRALIHAFREQP